MNVVRLNDTTFCLKNGESPRRRTVEPQLNSHAAAILAFCVEAGGIFGVFVVPKADRVLCHYVVLSLLVSHCATSPS